MNERNLAAIAELLVRDGIAEPHAKAIAMSLASAGLLMPSALTEDEAEKLLWEVDSGYYTGADLRRSAVEFLARIARGMMPGDLYVTKSIDRPDFFCGACLACGVEGNDAKDFRIVLPEGTTGPRLYHARCLPVGLEGTMP